MYLQKEVSKNILKKNLFFDGILSATDEKSRIRIRIRKSVVGYGSADPQIPTKMSRFPNTDPAARNDMYIKVPVDNEEQGPGHHDHDVHGQQENPR